MKDDKAKADWCQRNCMAHARMRQFNSIATNLYNRLATAMKLAVDEEEVLGSVKDKSKDRDREESGKQGGSRGAGGGILPLGSMRDIDAGDADDVNMNSVVVSYSTANALRLILTWALARNLLRLRPPVAADGALSVARVPQCNANADMVQALLSGTEEEQVYADQLNGKNTFCFADSRKPPRMDWRIVAVGKRTYSAPLRERSFEGLLASFTDCVEVMHVPVAWIHCRHIAPEKIIMLVTDSLAQQIVAFLKTVFKASDALELLGSFGGFTIVSALVGIGSGDPSMSGKGIMTFNPKDRDKELERLEELFTENLSALSWTIPRSGNATLVCANCMPTDDQLRSLFVGPPDSVGYMSEEEREQWRNWQSTSKTSRSSMQIEFFSDEPTAYGGGGADCVPLPLPAPSQSSRSSAKEQSNVIDYIEATRFEIIRDVPLGLRILNSIRLGSQSERCLRLIGRGEGFEGGLRQGRTVNVKVLTADSTWNCCRHYVCGSSGGPEEELLDSSGKPRRALMPTHSLQQVAQHMGSEPVFAISYTLTLVGDDMARAEGVSVLPVGRKWLALALACHGMSYASLQLTAKEEPSDDEVTSTCIIVLCSTY
jgi:hypothetical protein